MLSSEQVIPGISLSPPALRATVVVASSLGHPVARGSNNNGAPSPAAPLGAGNPRERQQQQQLSANGCRTDCFLFRAFVPRPLFPRVAAARK